MAVHWECGKTANYEAAKAALNAAPEVNGEPDYDIKEWSEHCNLREALIWALLVTGFPPKSEWAITEKNWQVLFGRLYVLERCNGAYRFSFKDEKRTNLYFTPEEIHSMIGMEVNAGNKSDTEFWTYIKNQYKDRFSRDVKSFEESGDE